MALHVHIRSSLHSIQLTARLSLDQGTHVLRQRWEEFPHRLLQLFAVLGQLSCGEAGDLAWRGTSAEDPHFVGRLLFEGYLLSIYSTSGS